MNKSILVGNLTRDPELATTTNNVSRCTFGLAVNRSFANAAGEREVDYFNIVTWRGLAEACNKYLKKGSKIALIGRLETNSFEQDGVKKFTTNVIAEDIDFLTRGSSNKSEEESSDAQDVSISENSDLPF